MQVRGEVLPDGLGTVAGDGAKCCRSVPKVSQVCKKRRTCDAILLLWPICVAGDTKNADLRRFIEGPATVCHLACDDSGFHLQQSGLSRATVRSNT